MSDMEYKLFCPYCTYEQNRETPFTGGDDVPFDGAFTICIACLLPSVFAEQVTILRYPTPVEVTFMCYNDKMIASTAAVIRLKAFVANSEIPPRSPQYPGDIRREIAVFQAAVMAVLG